MWRLVLRSRGCSELYYELQLLGCGSWFPSCPPSEWVGLVGDRPLLPHLRHQSKSRRGGLILGLRQGLAATFGKLPLGSFPSSISHFSLVAQRGEWLVRCTWEYNVKSRWPSPGSSGGSVDLWGLPAW